MRAKLITSIVIFVIIGACISIVAFGPSLLTNNVSGAGISPSSGGADNAIVRENTQLGTLGWLIPSNRAASTQVQAYAGATSVAPGKSITFYVSTQQDKTPYRLDVYRLGWYEGTGGRLMAAIGGLTGHMQGYYDSSSNRLVNCSSCYVDPTTRLIEANWQPSYTLQVAQNWTSGVYLAKFTDANGMQTYAPFDVLGNTHSAYIAVTQDTTLAAYNAWGGYSLYDQDESGTASENSQVNNRASMVSFDRPYGDGNGAAQTLLFELPAIRWMEQHGYDVSYASSVDLDEHPEQLLQHKAYISLGHDEYWTKSMRDGVENARDHGVGLIFMGADASYWQMRFGANQQTGVADRTLICYKVLAENNDYARDPMYGVNNSVVTSQWRDPVINRPENALVGIMFSDLTHKQFGYPWRVDPQADPMLLHGTGLQPGQEYGCGLVGYEWDKVFPGSPSDLRIIATTNTTNDTGQPDTSNTTYYIAKSGAMVFASGSIYWATALDAFRAVTDTTCGGKDTPVPAIQTLMANVMSAVVEHH
ncbi:MAG TPA: N,N-dimethylformamidase beta subunit family domain-containing protein [Ktedonobacteraceae bacterium]